MCKILVKAQKCNYAEIVPKKSHLKVPGRLKASKLSQLVHFRFHCLFEEGYLDGPDHLLFYKPHSDARKNSCKS